MLSSLSSIHATLYSTVSVSTSHVEWCGDNTIVQLHSHLNPCRTTRTQKKTQCAQLLNLHHGGLSTTLVERIWCWSGSCGEQQAARGGKVRDSLNTYRTQQCPRRQPDTNVIRGKSLQLLLTNTLLSTFHLCLGAILFSKLYICIKRDLLSLFGFIIGPHTRWVSFISSTLLKRSPQHITRSTWS